MIKNRTVQLIFESAYCTMGIIGIVASLGVFCIDEGIRWDFYIHFTNSSNYFCIGIVFAELIQTIRKKENDYVSACPLLKFMGVLMILLTFLAFNIVLAPVRESYLNFRINSVLFHLVLPVMYVLDWFLFYERRRVRWYYPLVSVVPPVIYAMFIFVRAWIHDFNIAVPYLYPYFFLNLYELGWGGVMKWIAALFLLFLGAGYIFCLFDRIRPRAKDNTA